MKNWEVKLLRFALKNDMRYANKNADHIELFAQKWTYTLNLFDGFRGNCSLHNVSESGESEDGVRLQIVSSLRCLGLEIVLQAVDFKGREFLLIKSRECRRRDFFANNPKARPWQYQFFSGADVFSESFVMTLLNQILFRFTQ